MWGGVVKYIKKRNTFKNYWKIFLDVFFDKNLSTKMKKSDNICTYIYIGVSPSGKASDSDSDIPVFESQYPSHIFIGGNKWKGRLVIQKV